MEEILQKIREERTRQDEKWGVQNHDDFVWNAILVEEVGEVSKALLTGGDLESELMQAAAVAIAWLESLHNNGASASPETAFDNSMSLIELPVRSSSLRRCRWLGRSMD